jgi:outer membrane protein TolC
MPKFLLSFFLIIFVFTSVSAQEKNLDYFISSAISSSPLLKDYNSQARSNLIDSLRLRAAYKPQVNAVSNNLYAPVIGGWGYDNAITNGINFGQLITVSKEVANKKVLQNQFEAIQLQNNSLAVTGKISEQDLKKTITSQYVTAYGSWQQYAFNKDVYQLLSREDTILKKLTEAGVYRQTDYLTFLVTLKQQKLSVTQARIQYQNEFSTLNYLSGLQDTSFEMITDPGLQINALPELENTVYYQKFTTDSLLLKNNDAQVDLNYKPKISLYADAGYLSSFAYQSYKNFGTSVGINLSMPIYDGQQKKMQHDKIAIAEQTRQQYRDYFKTQYNQEIAQLVQQLQAADEIIAEATDQIKYTEGLMQANRKLIATGDAHIADYIIALNNYLNAKNIITQNTTNKLQIINQINYWNRQ